MLELAGSTPATGRSMRCATSACPSREGEIVTLIGANGAGKSTTLMAICGVVPVPPGR